MRKAKHMIAEASHSDYTEYIRPTDGVFWPGDNCGEEVHAQAWYDIEKDGGWCHVRRFTDDAFAERFARNIEDLINCGRVGYGSATAGAGYSCYSLIKALTADNYHYNGQTLDYDEWIADGGNWRKTGGGYWFDWRGVKADEMDIWKLRHDCAIQCNGLGFVALQLLSGLWFHADDAAADGSPVYYLSTQPSFNFRHSFSTPYMFDRLCTVEPTRPCALGWTLSDITFPCHHVETRTEQASDIWGAFDGDDFPVQVHRVVYSLYGSNDAVWSPVTGSTGRKTADGRNMFLNAYEFVLCGTAERDGGAWGYTPAMEHLMSRDGVTLVPAFSVARDEPIFIDRQPDDITTPEGTVARFSIDAGSADGNDLKFQWEYQSPTMTNWVNSTLVGSKTATLSVTASAGRDGFRYRCRVYDDRGNELYSEPGTLRIGEEFAVTHNEVRQDGAAVPGDIFGITQPTNLLRGDVISTRLKSEGRTANSGHAAFWI